jgi:hypothetical protein
MPLLRDPFQPSYSSLFIVTLAISGLISLLLVPPSSATPTQAANGATPAPFTHDYVPPARETPMRTESAGVRLGEEKGPATVTQNTIATERLVVYRPMIGGILPQVYSLFPTVPAHLFKSISIYH